VSDPLPSVTVIIAARPAQAEVLAIEAARRLHYPEDRLEIIVARGKHPSVQRNAAVGQARGELIYFLDDDSVPFPDNLQAGANHFRDPVVKIVGGPNLCPDDAPLLEKVFATVLASWLGFGPSRARYSKAGIKRPASEKELILCNLMVRRHSLVESGGFNEALYPNEENALMDELQNRGGILIYDPDFVAHRRPRRNLSSFMKMLMTYGRGRAEQFRLHPSAGSALNFVPPLFCLYLLLLIPALIAAGAYPVALWAAAPLLLYAAAVLIQTVALIPAYGIQRSVLAMPLQAAPHIFYGIGFWRGLFTPLNVSRRRGDVPVDLETVVRQI
jgi:cellulose synthase/poly-beta-1,6-N-acetylglucosamine synthase-like glycosyltransferase